MLSIGKGYSLRTFLTRTNYHLVLLFDGVKALEEKLKISCNQSHFKVSKHSVVFPMDCFFLFHSGLPYDGQKKLYLQS